MLAKRDLSEPTLENLSYLLRHKSLWPEGFVWNYSFPDTCAMELAKERYWVSDSPWYGEMAQVFQMDKHDAWRIFTGLNTSEVRRVSHIKVANEIDKYLARQAQHA